jgi:site-specific DNA recombinase
VEHRHPALRLPCRPGTAPRAVQGRQGRTKTRLALDPDRAPVVAVIYAWRTEDKLGLDTITNRLNASPAAYPPPTDAGWIAAGVRSILANPKYTGHMVLGRRRKAGGKTRPVPPSEWLWSPEPTHPAIISRATWDTAQAIGAWHGTSRDGTEPSTHPQARRTYILRGRIRCKACQHRMAGVTRASGRHLIAGIPAQYTYYTCQHNPARHRRPADHPRTVAVREEHLLEAIRQFYAERIFGPERAALLAAQIPATAAQDTARRQQETARLTKRLHQIDTAENAHAREIEALGNQAGNAAAITALRTRIIARFTELETERTTINAQLAQLAATASQDADPSLLASLPALGDILNQAPPRLQQQLCQAFGLELLYRHDMHQVTIHATITDTTPATIAAIIADSDTPGHATTSPASHLEISDLECHQKAWLILHNPGNPSSRTGNCRTGNCGVHSARSRSNAMTLQ